MKKLFFAMAVAAMASSLTGCAQMPTSEELSHLNYGSPIDQASAERQASAYLTSRLKDPYSAVFSWQPVSSGWVKSPPLLGGGLDAGWILRGSVNAKNSYGGYTGTKPYQFMFYNGSLVHVWSADNDTGVMMKDM